jgi:preprotein translocase subunit SecG
MAIISGFFLVLLIISAVLLVIIVLMQDEQGEGLGGIFGGGGSGAPVGNRSGNILTRATAVIATIFLVSVFGYAWINRTPESSNVQAAARELEGDEAFLEWWVVDEPVDVPEDAMPTEAELQSAPEADVPEADSAEGEEETGE